MGKTRKKHVRPAYTAKANRPKAKRPPMPMSMKIGIASCVGALVLAVVLFFALYQDGSLPMRDGVAERGDNWLIVNLANSGSGKYYKLAEFDVPAGYTDDESAYSTTDQNKTDYWLVPEDPESPIAYAYVVGVTSPPKDMAQTGRAGLVGYLGEENVSEAQTATVAGREAYYFTAITLGDEQGTEASKQLTCYLPAVRKAGIMVAVSAKVTEERPEPSDEELLAQVRSIAEHLTFEGEK